MDASVLFSACASPTGASREIIRSALREEVILIISEFAREGTERNLHSKRPEALAVFCERISDEERRALNAERDREGNA